MKKIFALLALASVSMGSFAQDVVPEEKYSIATNSFGSNWFVQPELYLASSGGKQQAEGKRGKTHGAVPERSPGRVAAAAYDTCAESPA